MSIALATAWDGLDTFAPSNVTTMAIPSGIVAGQLLLLQFNFFNTQGSPPTGTAPTITGWTLLATPNGQRQFYALYKIADSTDEAGSGSGDWTVNEADGFVLDWAGAAYSGVDNSTPFKAGPTPLGDTGDAFTDYSGQSQTGSSGDTFVMLLTIESNAGADPITSQPSGMTLQARGRNTFGTGDSLIYDQTMSGSSSGTPTGTHSAGVWGSITMILNPASSGSTIDADAGTDTPAVTDEVVIEAAGLIDISVGDTPAVTDTTTRTASYGRALSDTVALTTTGTVEYTAGDGISVSDTVVVNKLVVLNVSVPETIRHLFAN